MKADLENLKATMRRCAEAHRVKFLDRSDKDLLVINADSAYVLSDVRMICEAFYGTFSPLDAENGHTLVWLGMPFLSEVNVGLLNMALSKSMAMAA